MNKLNIEPVAQSRISIEVTDTASGVGVSFVGDVDMQDPGVILDPLFEKIHGGCISAGIKEVDLDFKQLNFLNSSGIKAIAKWIMKLGELSADKKYVIKIIHNKNITWQVTSLPTLTFLVPGAVKVE
jgi:hypothetical protein